jgi:hypothetical protein
MKVSEIFIISLFIATIMFSNSSAYIYEQQYITPGNIHGGDDGCCGFGSITKLPDSNFVLIALRGKQDEGQLHVFDAEKLQYLGSLSGSYIYYLENAILKVEDGWDVYMIGVNITKPDSKDLIKIHISSNGEIQTMKRITEWTDSNQYPKIISHPTRNQIFLFTTKIYRYIPGSNSFENFSYPDGWSENQPISNLFVLEGENIVILRSNQSGSVWNLAWWDINSCSGQIIGQNINLLEVNPWGSEINKYLCNVNDKIMIFDSSDKSFTNYIENLPPHDSSLPIDDSGKYLYGLQKNNENGPSLLKIDLDNKSYETKPIEYDSQNYLFTGYRWFKIPGKNLILTELDHKEITYNTRCPSLLDLDTNKIKLINEPGVLDDTYQNIYFPEFERVILNNPEDSLAVLDLTTESFLESCSFGSKYDHFKKTKSFIGTVSEKGRYFSKLDLEIGKREISDIGYFFLDWGVYPDLKDFLITYQNPNFIDPTSLKNNLEYIYEYDFENKRIMCSDIPPVERYPFYYFSDFINTQILVVHYVSPGMFYFIKDYNDYEEWVFPYPDMIISHDFDFLLDEENGYFWIAYTDDNNSFSGLIKLNTIDKTYDDYRLSSIKGSLGIWNIYNNGEYILSKTANFCIIDPVNDEIKFQTLIYSASGKKATPAIVPVPEKDRIFLWDGKMVWQIDVKNMELISGEVYQNPNQDQTNGSMSGYYNKEMNELIFYDSADSKSVLRVDADTGKIIEQIPIIFNRNYKCVFDTKNMVFHFLKPDTGKITSLRLLDSWDSAPTIKPQGQFVEYRPGDNFKLILDIANPADVLQDVTAYIWFWLPTGQYIFFGPNGLTTEVVGIPITLPANLDTSVSIDLFTVPQGMPAGFYNLNAVFFNNRTAVRGPMGTYNFIAGQ